MKEHHIVQTMVTFRDVADPNANRDALRALELRIRTAAISAGTLSDHDAEAGVEASNIAIKLRTGTGIIYLYGTDPYALASSIQDVAFGSPSGRITGVEILLPV